MLLLTGIVNVLIYCFIELEQLLKVNCHVKLCIKFCRSPKLPIFFYKMSDTIYSYVNPLLEINIIMVSRNTYER